MSQLVALAFMPALATSVSGEDRPNRLRQVKLSIHPLLAGFIIINVDASRLRGEAHALEQILKTRI